MCCTPLFVETTGIEIKEEEEESKKEEEPKEEPKKVDEGEIDKALDDIMDIDKFQKRKDKFTQKEYKKCQEFQYSQYHFTSLNQNFTIF